VGKISDFNKLELQDLLRTNLQEGLEALCNSSMPINKYWEYVGKIIITKQVLGRMGAKVRINVSVEDESGV
jgi:hypothetical protein